MRNRLSYRSLFAGLLLFFGICFESASAQAERETTTPSPQAMIENLTQADNAAKNDSLLQVVPIDTSTITDVRRFDESLAKKYASDDELNYKRNNNKSFFRKIKEWINEIVRKLLGYGEETDIDKITNIILDIIYGIIFLTVVYIIVRLVMNHKGRWFFEKKNEQTVIDLSNVEQHIHEADFDALLKEAERNGDTRQSVRLLYLWLLKTFAGQGIIEWNAEKTNIDYLNEINDSQLKTDFRYLSYLFNYIWYGGFSIGDTEYKNARSAFQKHIHP